MSPLKFLTVILLAIVIVVATLAGGVAAYGREAIWEHLFGPPDLGPYDFDMPTRTGKLNDALACPEDAAPCGSVGMDRITPAFAVDGPSLFAAARDLVAAMPGTEIVDDRPDTLSLRAVVRTSFLRFPDTLSLQVRERAPGESIIWLYSRSQIGHADLGTNERRIRRILRELRRNLPMLPRASSG